MEDKKRAEIIRQKNDRLRRSLVVVGRFALCSDPNAKVLVTVGINNLDDKVKAKILQAVAAFDDFSSDNDPYGEHDFGKVEAEGVAAFFKIDYLDLKLEAGSPDPTNDAVTKRVMTIMLPNEY